MKIILGVLAPHSIETALSELSTGPYSISTDSSNHKCTKLFPLIIRYFHYKNGIKTILLDLESLPGETADEVRNEIIMNRNIAFLIFKVYNWIVKILKKYNLNLNSLVAFCGDNVPTNFGGVGMSGEGNVFAKLKSHRGNLVPIGCPAHVIHNSAKYGADQLPFDIEAISFKMSSHFRFSTKRIEKLKDIFEEFEVCF